MSESIITQLRVYPIKGMGGISLQKATLTNTGIAYDRQFMLVNEDGLFISQRTNPELSQFRIEFSKSHFVIAIADKTLTFYPEKDFKRSNSMSVKIFQHQMLAYKAMDHVNDWFSNALGTSVSLVEKAEKRFVNNHPDTEINFSDSSQYLMLGEASLDFLNSKLEESVRMNRFRPNIVFSSATPHQEDTFRSIQIGQSKFEYVKQCGRCKVTTVDQETGSMGFEPLHTLSGYRKGARNILFGSYFKWVGGAAEIQIGDFINLSK